MKNALINEEFNYEELRHNKNKNVVKLLVIFFGILIKA